MTYRRQDVGVFKVISLEGSWRDMGRAYGESMRQELLDFYRLGVEEHLMGQLGRSQEDLKALGGGFFRCYPHRFKEFVRGMAEGSGMELWRHLALGALEVAAVESLVGHCSCVAAWGEYTGGGPLVVGRNYDYLPRFKDYGRFINALCLRPADGSVPVCIVGYIGTFYVTTALNGAGLFLELNNGMPSGGDLWYQNRIPNTLSLLSFLLDSSSLEEMEAHFLSVRAAFASVVTVCDEDLARCYEWPVFDVKSSPVVRPGLLVATNHFTNPNWGLPEPRDERSWYSVTRRNNLINLADNLKGGIDEDVMREILDTRIEDLGATSDYTVYQVVGSPKNRRLWLKVPHLTGWTRLDLAEHLGV
ncbi:hypothetical protein TheveDRAFT_1709 [Thermanaerovibrio velox DSM 12556]|uniref:Acyl-coenzyme A:6-aminopenicillanic acid acyl-transferase n=1 Tax=Thermanaerovibrio velox DSM 12556 TaxID=926567 RepID=H0UQS4_9BACT|nr:C45 family peptidase [Thermanaerovibrio velox]EHM10827.1 hypothetical protein TheveDRAFT_1709 [Thermanaerovibrio velox DSM 12556]